MTFSYFKTPLISEYLLNSLPVETESKNQTQNEEKESNTTSTIE